MLRVALEDKGWKIKEYVNIADFCARNIDVERLPEDEFDLLKSSQRTFDVVYGGINPYVEEMSSGKDISYVFGASRTEVVNIQNILKQEI